MTEKKNRKKKNDFKILNLGIMSSIATAVFKATIGLLVNKGRDKAAEKLKDGDVTDQKFRGLIVREIDDIKDKLDGLSRKDLGASISSFKEGIVLLYEVFNKARLRNEYGAATAPAVCVEAFTLAEEMIMLELTDLDGSDSAKRKLSSAKKRFRHARKKASEAFNNEGLKISDRILAMQYRVMATILETVDNPEDALEPCRVCTEELNSLPAVQNSFNVQLKKGIQAVRSLVGKDERRKIISSVCHVNRVVYDVTQTVRKDLPFWIWPALNVGEVDPLRDGRVAEVLRKQEMEHCCVTPWSFGQESEEEHRLKNPWGIATNSSGQLIVGDINDVKMFDPTGQFVEHFSLPNDNVKTKLDIWDVATGNKDNIYVLVQCKKKTGSEEFVVYKFSNTADLHHKFPVRGEGWARLIVTNSKVLVLRNFSVDCVDCVDVYDTDGLFVLSFGDETLENPWDITAANDGRVMVVDWDDCVHIFSEDGDHLDKFNLQGSYRYTRIAFHQLSEHVVIAGKTEESVAVVEIFTKVGEFVRSTQIHEDTDEERIDFIAGMTVTRDGRIAVLLRFIGSKWKVLVI